MSLSGRLSVMSVPEALRFLGPNRRSGVLSVDAGLCHKEVVLQDGHVVFCSSGWPKERLGHHLVARTGVTEADLARAFARQEQEGGRLGEILVDDGRLTPQALRTVLRCKLEDSVYDLFTWHDGSFRFEDRPATDVPARLDLSWQEVMVGGTRRVSELPAIRQRVPSGATRFRVASEEDAAALGPAGRKREVFELAASGLTADEICQSRHETDFEVLSLLAGLVGDGLLEREEEARGGGGPAVASACLALGRQLLDDGRLIEALDVLQDARRRHPENSEVGISLAAARRLARHRVERRLGCLDSVPALVEPGLPVELTTARERVVTARINGQWSIGAITRICPLDELDVLVVLDTLFQDGRITLTLPQDAAEVVEPPLADIVADPVRIPETSAPDAESAPRAPRAGRTEPEESGRDGRETASLTAAAAAWRERRRERNS